MKKLIASAIAAAALSAALPAAATTWTSVQTGAQFMQSVTFNGIIDGVVQSGLSGKIDYTLTSVAGNTWTFGYTLTNTSSSPIDASRISVFGFDVTPDALTSTSLAGIFDVVASGPVPQPNLHPDGSLEFCYKDTGPTNNCTGGASGGVTFGNSAAGSFNLVFSAPPSSVTFLNHLIRYQSISAIPGVTLSGDSAIGLPSGGPPTVPEPATWAMMIVGFGLAGTMIRRARRQHVLAI